MTSANLRVLKDLFEHHLHFTPTWRDNDQFEADLKVVSPSLLKSSLKELGRGKRKPVGGKDWRKSMFDIYYRKVAEHAQMFPVFHCFETAFRSTVAVELEDHYGIQQWWMPTYRQITGGATVTRIGNVQNVLNGRLKSIKLLVENYIKFGLSVPAYQDGYELLEDSTLSDLRRIIEQHWPIFKDRFSVNGQPMTLVVFLYKFDLVREARNDVYHHKSFGGMKQVYLDAEVLMKCLNFDLPPIHKSIATTPCQPPVYF